ncbi:hypothetical protein H6G04_34835 [Calothrix membranacea FACHB-236]|nr:hypothetical protein [Calothrix membranacea FACHB-236]
MSILFKLRNRKLGFFELLVMGFNLYLKHFRSFFSLVCMISTFSAIFQFFPLNIIEFLFNGNYFICYLLFTLFYFFVVEPVSTIIFAIFVESYILGGNPQLNITIQGILPRIMQLNWLSITFNTIFMLRLLLIVVPGVIYLVNNIYYYLAFILRDQKGEAAFQYSRALVKSNWWEVFFFYVLSGIITFVSNELMNKIISSIIINSPISVTILSSTLTSLVLFGVGISKVLLFLNLEFQKK